MDNKMPEYMIPDFVIVAGGQATRLLPLTAGTAKVLLPVAGLPIIEHQFSWLHKQGVKRVVLCLGHLAEQIERYVRGSAWNELLEIVISNEGESKLGTAGAVKLAIDRGLLRGSFFTLYGDTIPQFRLSEALCVWKLAGVENALCVFECGDLVEFARARVSGDRVVQFERYPFPEVATLLTHGDYGVAVFNEDAFEKLGAGIRSGFGQIHSSLASEGKLLAIEVASSPIEIGTPSQLECSNVSMNTSRDGYIAISKA